MAEIQLRYALKVIYDHMSADTVSLRLWELLHKFVRCAWISMQNQLKPSANYHISLPLTVIDAAAATKHTL